MQPSFFTKLKQPAKMEEQL